MLIRFEMYRSKIPDEMFDSGSIQVDIVNEQELVKIDEVILNVLNKYRTELPVIKKYGVAYMGRLRLVDLTITDSDTAIDLDEGQFNHYIQSIIPGIVVIWNKTTNNTTEEEKVVKLDFGKSVKEENDGSKA